MSMPDVSPRRRTVIFAVALLVQVAIIAMVVGVNASTVSQGRSVFLRIAPVDPRDPLRGDFLTFSYDISTVNRETFTDTPDIGETVYVPLMRTGDYWTPTYGATSSRPDGSSSSEVFIRGIVSGMSSTSVAITYGAEEYFIPEGSGADFPLDAETAARISVDSAGRAVLRQVYVDGKPWP